MKVSQALKDTLERPSSYMLPGSGSLISRNFELRIFVFIEVGLTAVKLTNYTLLEERGRT